MEIWPLISLIPEGVDVSPPVGQRLRWPDDDREWIWDGEHWVVFRRIFDGGDAWDDPEAADEAA